MYFALSSGMGKTCVVKTLVTDSTKDAAEFIKHGGLAAFPTETVYGLGADIFNEDAIREIFKAKGRPSDNPLIAHVADFNQIDKLTDDLTASARSLLREFSPGPLTVVVRSSPAVPRVVRAGLETIGIRLPRLELARNFLAACGGPVAAPSANISGRPSPTTWQAVLEDLNGRIDCVLQGPESEIGLESTVVDCTGETPVVLRAGSISLEQLRGLIPEIGMYSENCDATPRSPGMKHRHYSPSGKVVIGNKGSNGKKSSFIGISNPTDGFDHLLVCKDIDEYARSLYEFFRESDRLGIQSIYCEPVAETGIGLALMDRIRRAAESVG